MGLIEEIEEVFKENQDRITLALIMELVDDVIESCVSLVAKSTAEHEILKVQIRNKMEVQIKQNLERKRDKC